jgi:YggT family protein
VGILLVNLLPIALFALGLLSWFDPAGRSQAGAFVVAATEPLLGPIRRALPPTGMLDLSPFVVLIVLSVLWRLI